MPTSIPWNSAGPSSLRYQGMSWYFSGDQQETWQTNPDHNNVVRKWRQQVETNSGGLQMWCVFGFQFLSTGVLSCFWCHFWMTVTKGSNGGLPNHITYANFIATSSTDQEPQSGGWVVKYSGILPKRSWISSVESFNSKVHLKGISHRIHVWYISLHLLDC